MATISDLIGSYNNLNEQPAFLNAPHHVLGVVIPFLTLSWLCALLRLYTRIFIIKCPWWDDLFVVLALLSATAGSVAVCLATNTGMGKHLILLSQEESTKYFKMFYVVNAMYPSSTSFIKMALLLQFLRVYDRASRIRIVIVIIICIVSAWWLAFSYLTWVPCIPVSAFWGSKKPAIRYAFGSLQTDAFVASFTSMTASNMVLDLIILAIPVPFLFYQRQSTKRCRCSLIGLLALGTLWLRHSFTGSRASIISIWRLASIVETQAATKPTFDPTWYSPTPVVLAVLEVDLATVCAALPVFWPVLKQMSMSEILVTREVEVTLENRHFSATSGTNLDDDAVELQYGKIGLQKDRGNYYYEDPCVAQQVDPLALKDQAIFGTTAEVNAVNQRAKQGAH